MAVNTKKTVKFNPTITAMFPNDKFGSGALLSAEINSKGFAEVQNHLQVGSKLVLRKSPKKTESGNDCYFLEILAPRDGGVRTGGAGGGARKASVSDDV